MPLLRVKRGEVALQHEVADVGDAAGRRAQGHHLREALRVGRGDGLALRAGARAVADSQRRALASAIMSEARMEHGRHVARGLVRIAAYVTEAASGQPVSMSRVMRGRAEMRPAQGGSSH